MNTFQNELKRIRQNEEEILRGEPEDCEALAEAGAGEILNLLFLCIASFTLSTVNIFL